VRGDARLIEVVSRSFKLEPLVLALVDDELEAVRGLVSRSRVPLNLHSLDELRLEQLQVGKLILNIGVHLCHLDALAQEVLVGIEALEAGEGLLVLLLLGTARLSP